jgi:hypothetical protein
VTRFSQGRYASPVGAPNDLDGVRDSLIATLQHEGKLSMVNARVILRTGVNLMQPKPSQLRDPKELAKVLAALREMGFDI